MPHSLFELNEMSREQLVSLATQLDIKVTKKMEMEEIAFSILDAEAKAESLKPAEKPKAKRGGQAGGSPCEGGSRQGSARSGRRACGSRA